MMTKKQKIWLWVSLAMFAIPEILWSPILNFSYSIWEGRNIPTILRDNFLISSDNRALAIFVVFIQCLGILASLIFVLQSEINIILKIILSIIALLLFVLSSLVLIFLSATINMGF